MYGYEVTRQTGSHMRLTTVQDGEHHVTIPRHGALKPGTLAGILRDVAKHFGIERQELNSLGGALRPRLLVADCSVVSMRRNA
jgi:predicted RNA binding protein YcfA (HicA-like mRNA interferase family)